MRKAYDTEICKIATLLFRTTTCFLAAHLANDMAPLEGSSQLLVSESRISQLQDLSIIVVLAISTLFVGRIPQQGAKIYARGSHDAKAICMPYEYRVTGNL